MVKISVVMGVYNTKEEWLRESIESILSQTYADFEFIIINDGSTNNVEDVILSYNDSRIKYYKQENQGLPKTLNRGLSIAQGEYIARFDSDDISLPDRFEKQVKFFEKNPEVSVLGTAYERFPDKQIVLHPEKPTYFDILRGCYIAHPSVMFRRADFEKYGLKYNENYIAAQDYELWSRAIRILKFANLVDPLIKYRCHGESVSASKKMIQLGNAQKIQQNMLDWLTLNKDYQENLKQFIFVDVNNEKNEKKCFIKKIKDKIRKISLVLSIKI